MTERMFPVLIPYADHRRLSDYPRSIPWRLIAPHAAQALRNHDQSLETLATRGGLSPLEIFLVMNGLKLRARDGDFAAATAEAETFVKSLLTGAPA